MRKFLKTLLYFSVIGLFPVMALLISYIYFDPFKVLRIYKDYSHPYVIPNRDVISTATFLRNNPKYHYNSFVFGSSRTLAYNPEEWHKYLHPNDHPFSFDASAESVYGIYKKLSYLDARKCKIDNALIVIDRDVTFKTSENSDGFLYIKHPLTSGESNIAFQSVFFKGYLTPMFLLSYYSYIIKKHYMPFMDGYINNRDITYDTINNRTRIVNQEKEIALDSNKYYEIRKSLFYQRKGERVDSIAKIRGKCLSDLIGIKNILVKNHTNYKVVLSPLYEEIKFNKKDLETLRNIFGNHLFDFSGRNVFTESKFNYYETEHYRPNVGNSIMNIIYLKRK